MLGKRWIINREDESAIELSQNISDGNPSEHVECIPSTSPGKTGAPSYSSHLNRKKTELFSQQGTSLDPRMHVYWSNDFYLNASYTREKKKERMMSNHA